MKNGLSKILITAFWIILCFSCREDEEDILRCEPSVLVDEDLFTAPSDPVTINYAEITGSCIEVRMEFSGCSENAEIHLVASENVMESFPLQRNIKISLQQDGECAASFNRTLRLDLTPLQVGDSDRVQLNLTNWDGGGLLYTY